MVASRQQLWERLWEQKKVRLSRSQEMMEELPQAWVNVRGGLRIFAVVLLAFGRMDVER